MSRQIVLHSMAFLVLTYASAVTGVTPDECQWLITDAREGICRQAAADTYDQEGSFASYQPSYVDVLSPLVVIQHLPTMEYPLVLNVVENCLQSSNHRLEQLSRDCLLVFYRSARSDWPELSNYLGVEPDGRFKGTFADGYSKQICYKVDCGDIEPFRTDLGLPSAIPDSVIICCLCDKQKVEKNSLRQQLAPEESHFVPSN